MTSKKIFYLMLGVLGLLVLVGGATVYLGTSMLKSESDKLLTNKLDNKVLEEQQVALVQANKDIEKYSELENIAKTVVPKDKDQAKTVREIVKLAEESGIRIGTITFPTSNLGTATPKPTTNNTSGEDSSSSSSSKPAEPSISQVKPVDGLNGVYQLEITVDSDDNVPVPYSRFIDFLEKLEQNRRTSQVTNITVEPAAKNRDYVTFSLVVNTYIKP